MEYKLLEAVRGASRIVIHADAVVIYLLIFYLLSNFPSYSNEISMIILSLSFPLYGFHLYLRRYRNAAQNAADHLLTFAILLSFGYGFTPIIR